MSSTLRRGYRFLKRSARGLRAGLSNGMSGATVAMSGLFDADFYAAAYPDVKASGMDPLAHFMKFGLAQGRRPSVQFDPVGYASMYGDVGGPGGALLHYANHGRPENRPIPDAPFPQGSFALIARTARELGVFDADFYAEQHPALKDSGMDPLVHYLVEGYRHHVEPAPHVYTRGYLGRYPDVRRSGVNPLAHWLAFGREEGRVLDGDAQVFPWFDDDRGFALPDDRVHHALLAGKSYFGRMGFRFEDRDSASGIERAAQLMARRQPLLTLEADTPDVSIIIPVYGQTHFALGCLDSLAEHRSRHSVEIIVADDASPEALQTGVLASIPWIRCERRAENGGFLECCNWAVQRSRGRYVVLLNSDTRVVDGWLDELIEGFRLFPKAGMVGSKLFNDDGTLQEAGGIFWRDGSAHNYGRGQDSNDPQYCYARQADFISGASIALPRAIWDEMGGFDPYYKPAYCEDADLAFRLRRSGHEVWYIPFSRAIHYEGVTHGRDTSKGIKAYQVENLRKFAVRFARELAQHPEPGVPSVRAANWRATKGMLFVDALTPTPDKDSGSIVTHEVMATYRAMGFGEHFWAEHNPVWIDRYTTALQRLGVCCHYRPYAKEIRDVVGSPLRFDYALLYRHNVAQAALEPIRAKSPATRILFANVDLHFLRESRAAATEGNDAARFGAVVTKRSELEMFAHADASFVHTDVERTLIQAELPAPVANIVVLPWLSDQTGQERAFDERADVMFLGNFPHAPNVDSIKYFMESIWPLMVESLPPQARLLVVGNQPPPEVKALASERVIVTGYVEELDPYFASSRIFVAPLRYGAGIKGKLVMALAHGVPSIATSIAAEGIGGDRCAHLRVADDPQGYAQHALEVYRDPAVWHALRDAGVAFVQENYSREAAAKLCAQALQLADETWLRRQEFTRRARLVKIMADNGETDYSEIKPCVSG